MDGAIALPPWCSVLGLCLWLVHPPVVEKRPPPFIGGCLCGGGQTKRLSAADVVADADHQFNPEGMADRLTDRHPVTASEGPEASGALVVMVAPEDPPKDPPKDPPWKWRGSL